MRPLKSYKILGFSLVTGLILLGIILLFVYQKISDPKSLDDFPRLSSEEMGYFESYKAIYFTNPVKQIYGYEGFSEFDMKNHITEKMNFIHKSCSKNDFIGYRECLLREFAKIQKFLIKNDSDNIVFEKFYDGIRFEITQYNNYKKIDNLPALLPKFHINEQGQVIGENGVILAQNDMRLMYPYDENRCTAIAKTDLLEKDPHGYPHEYPYIWLSFSYGQGIMIEKIFPNYHKKILQQWNGGSYHGKPRSNPCWYRTFGPEMGNIIHSVVNEDGKFLFIVYGGGGGSGEFDYFVFFQEHQSKKWNVIGVFPMYGIHPFDFNYDTRGTVPKSKIREYGRDRLLQAHTYLYGDDFLYKAGKITELLTQAQSLDN